MQLEDFIVNNWPLFMALVIVSFLLARTWIGPGAISNVRPTEAVQLINQGAMVVDVRTDKEYQEGHIINAMHIPLGVLDSRISELKDYKTNPMIIACRSGARSSTAIVTLKKHGFENVNNLGGGMLAWGSSNLPVTSDPTQPRKHARKPRVIGNDNTNEVLVYTTRNCPFCTRAIDLLEDKGLGYTELRIEHRPDLRKEMEKRAQRTSVPQIFIGDEHVGGCDDLYELEDQGKLDGMLGLTARV